MKIFHSKNSFLLFNLQTVCTALSAPQKLDLIWRGCPCCIQIFDNRRTKPFNQILPNVLCTAPTCCISRKESCDNFTRISSTVFQSNFVRHFYPNLDNTHTSMRQIRIKRDIVYGQMRQKNFPFYHNLGVCENRANAEAELFLWRPLLCF